MHLLSSILMVPSEEGKIEMRNALLGGLSTSNSPVIDQSLQDFGLPGATVERQRGFIRADSCDQILKRLTETIEWEQRDVIVRGNTYKQPRLVAWYGTGAYTYSGMTLEPKPLTNLLQRLQAKVEDATGRTFNSVLLNRYVAGQNHGIGNHSDDEPELGRDPVIAMLTFGEGRALEFEPKPWIKKSHPEAATLKIDTPAGSLLVMRGATQRNWKHGLPKARGKQDRITLTFRTIS